MKAKILPQFFNLNIFKNSPETVEMPLFLGSKAWPFFKN